MTQIDQNKKIKLGYLCLQATREGQASFAHVREIIKGLQKRNWEIELFEPSYAKTSHSFGPLTRLWNFFFVQWLLWWAYFTRFPFKALYIRGHFATWPSLVISRIMGIPVIFEVNGPYEDLFAAWPGTRPIKLLFIFLIKSQIKWASRLITVTSTLKEWAEKETGQKKTEVIPNGANTDLFHPEATSEETPHKPYVIFFGALTIWQGVDLMLEALSQKEWPKEVDLVILGKGKEEDKIKKAALNSANLKYMGQQPYEKLPGLIAQSIGGLVPKSTLHTPSQESWMPLKLFETLACGVPVLVTDFPGQGDFVRTYQCGIVIPQDNSWELAQSVKYLFLQKKIREDMGKRGRAAIVEAHSWDQRAKETDRVLRSVLK